MEKLARTLIPGAPIDRLGHGTPMARSARKSLRPGERKSSPLDERLFLSRYTRACPLPFNDDKNGTPSSTR